MQTKDDVEKTFRQGGTLPVHRSKLGDYDVFIADGFSHPPHFRIQRFGIEPDDFPGGVWVTIWWLGKDEKLFFGQPLFFTDFIQSKRIGAARKEAEAFVKKLKKRQADGTKH